MTEVIKPQELELKDASSEVSKELDWLKKPNEVKFSDTQNDIQKIELQKTELQNTIKWLPDNVSNEELLTYAELIQNNFKGKKCDDMMVLLYQKQYDVWKSQLNISSFILPRNIDKKQSHSASEYIGKLQENIPDDQSLKYDSAFFASEELKQEAFLEVYKTDMLEAIYWFMTSYNNQVTHDPQLTDIAMRSIVTILSNGSSAKDIYKLSWFLMDSTNITAMSNITSFNETHKNEMVDNLFGSLYKLYTEHRSNIDPTNKDFVLDSDSPNRKILPNWFTFTTTKEELQKLVDLANQKSSYSMYAENASIRKSDFHLWSWEEKIWKHVNISLAADNNAKEASDWSTIINLGNYSTWRLYEWVDNNTNSMQTFINTPYRWSIVHLDDMLSKDAKNEDEDKNIDRVVLTEKDFDKYGKILQERYPNTLFEKSLSGKNNIIYKGSVDRISNNFFVGKQEFYAWDTQFTDENTVDLVNEDFVLNLNNQILQLEQNPDIVSGSTRIHIESCASHLPAPQDQTNKELASERGENMKKSILDKAKTQGIPLNETMFDDIDAKVDWPEHPTDRTFTQEEIQQLEKDVYRKFQYVKVSIKYETEVSKESSSSSTPGLSSNTNKNDIQLNSFSINIPPSQLVESDGSNDKQNKKMAKKQNKSFNRINKKI